MIVKFHVKFEDCKYKSGKNGASIHRCEFDRKTFNLAQKKPMGTFLCTFLNQNNDLIRQLY